MQVLTDGQKAAGISGGDSAGPTGKMGKDEFVKLLMAQLGHQDPLSPMDSQAFVAQLAQFANVELLQATNGRLEALLVAQAAGNQMSAASLVGKDVLYRSEQVTLEAGAGAAIQGELAQAASSVTVVLTDAAGKTVRTLKLGAYAQGPLDIAWDGLDDQGQPLPAGDYRVQITAADSEGNNVAVEQRALSRIVGVSFQNGYPELLVGNSRIKLSEVVEIDEAK